VLRSSLLAHQHCLAVAAREKEGGSVSVQMLLLEAPHDGQCIVKHVAVLRGEHRHIKLLRSIGAEVETKGIVVETIVDQVHPLPIALALSVAVHVGGGNIDGANFSLVVVA
jgi:hypothetical protein